MTLRLGISAWSKAGTSKWTDPSDISLVERKKPATRQWEPETRLQEMEGWEEEETEVEGFQRCWKGQGFS